MIRCVWPRHTSCTHLLIQINHRAGLFQWLLLTKCCCWVNAIKHPKPLTADDWWEKGVNYCTRQCFCAKGIPSFCKGFININICPWLQPWQTTKSKSTMNSLIVNFNRISAKGKSSFCAANIQSHSLLLLS